MNKLKEDLRNDKISYSNVTLGSVEDIKKVGISAFLPHALVKKFALIQEGQELNFLEEIRKEPFKKKVHGIFADADKNNQLYYGGSHRLCVVIECLSSDDPEENEGARRWIEGHTPSPEDEEGKRFLKKLRAAGLDTGAKNISSITTDETLFFLRDLGKFLGYEPYLVAVDEIEKAAELPPKMGKTFLSGIRDLINTLYATDRDIPEQQGLFVAISISDPYLEYAGISDEDVPDLDFVGGRMKFGKPKTDLREVPRLWTVLHGLRVWADANIRDKEVMVKIGEEVKTLCKKAYGDDSIDRVDIRAVVERHRESWPWLLPRWYIPEFINECRKAVDSGK
jgi:hypothetical protein